MSEQHMVCIFDMSKPRKILDANRNTYTNPVFHPTRKLGYHDIIYVVEGGFGVSLNNETIYAKKDSVVILPAEVTHYGITKCTPGTRTMFLHIAHENGDGYTNHTAPEIQKNKKYLKSHIEVSDTANVKKYFENIFLYFSGGDDIYAAAWLSVLLCKLGEKFEHNNVNYTLAYKIKSIIDEDLCADISNGRLAEEIGRSIKSTESHFKKTFGITIHRYIISEKLKKSKFYLKNFPDMSIRSVAEALGFYDEFHFSRNFKKEFGITPSKFRSETLTKEFISCK